MTASVGIFLAVLFTINRSRSLAFFNLNMGWVPVLCVAWLVLIGLLTREDVYRSSTAPTRCGRTTSSSCSPGQSTCARRSAERFLHAVRPPRRHAAAAADAATPARPCVRASVRPHPCRYRGAFSCRLTNVSACPAASVAQVAHRFVDKYGRSPWGLFWALGCFSGVMTVVIPDDIVTMTMTPVTIRMCHLLNLPELPFLFSQFFAVIAAARRRTPPPHAAARLAPPCPSCPVAVYGRLALTASSALAALARPSPPRPYRPCARARAGNIWAVTLVTGNPTNVLLAEDLGDTFMSFAARMRLPGIAAGLTSFALMYWTNRHKVASCPPCRWRTLAVHPLHPSSLRRPPPPSLHPHSFLPRFLSVPRPPSPPSTSTRLPLIPGVVRARRTVGAGRRRWNQSGYHSEGGDSLEHGGSSGGGGSGGGGGKGDAHAFTGQGLFCLVRLIAASAFCALDSLHGLPVYLCVLIIGIAAFSIDVVMDATGCGGAQRGFAADVVRHMPWELLAFVSSFLVLAEAMAITVRPATPAPRHARAPPRPRPATPGRPRLPAAASFAAPPTHAPTPPRPHAPAPGRSVTTRAGHLAVARDHLPAARAARSVAFVSSYTTMVFCNISRRSPRRSSSSDDRVGAAACAPPEVGRLGRATSSR